MFAGVILVAIAAALIAALGDGWRPFRPTPTGPVVVVYRDPPCRCCVRWVESLRDQGFEVEEHVTPDLAAVCTRTRVRESLKSCHTAQVAGYVIEGHVPAEDIRRLLREKPAVRGLAVPGMPGASPGMEPYSEDRSPYEVLVFGAEGARGVFSRHPPDGP